MKRAVDENSPIANDFDNSSIDIRTSSSSSVAIAWPDLPVLRVRYGYEMDIVASRSCGRVENRMFVADAADVGHIFRR